MKKLDILYQDYYAGIPPIRSFIQGLSLLLMLFCAEAAAQTNTFIDKADPADVRVVSFNPLWNTIFPDQDPTQAAKFERIAKALDADIWCLQETDYYYANDVKALLDDYVPIGGAGWQVYGGGDNIIASKYALSNTMYSIPSADKTQAIALVDLPDGRFSNDLYIFNNHYKCCSGYDSRRQQQSDAIISWWRDIMNGEGSIFLPADTAMMVIGDLNLIESPQPLSTLLTGDIQDNATFGPDQAPDWDGTNNTDSHPIHNSRGPDDYTWRDDASSYDPSRMDYITYTDSVLQASHSFILNTAEMTAQELADTSLQAGDVAINLATGSFDHLPVVVDFRPVSEPVCGDYGYPAMDFNQDCIVDILDLSEFVDGWLNVSSALDFADFSADWLTCTPPHCSD